MAALDGPRKHEAQCRYAQDSSSQRKRKLYTWWSYRARDRRLANKGRRLDHIWVTPDLKDQVVSVDTLNGVRGWEKMRQTMHRFCGVFSGQATP